MRTEIEIQNTLSSREVIDTWPLTGLGVTENDYATARESSLVTWVLNLNAALEEAALDYAPDGSAGKDADTLVDFPAGEDPLNFIDRGGCTIQVMQEHSGARFHNREKHIVTISGPAECVQLRLANAHSILSVELEHKANEAT